MASNANKGRMDLVKGTKEPHPPVQPLGSSSLHGPSRDQHIVVVLGVGPGLGVAIARLFAQQGYTTAILSRNKQRLDEWAKELDQMIQQVRGAKADTPQALAFACDVLSNEAIVKAMMDIEQAWPSKRIGTAIYNASVRKRAPFLDLKQVAINDSVQASM
jgi:NAD(P)-dependent dehydrogenase (short-subunit alcohol dehydrogenase family)